MAIQKKFLVGALGAPTADDLYRGSNGGADIWGEVEAGGPGGDMGRCRFHGGAFPGPRRVRRGARTDRGRAPRRDGEETPQGDYSLRGAPQMCIYSHGPVRCECLDARVFFSGLEL
eukprot:711870-Pyramimonas_sp.AAC.1